jgi:hypothetical protein
MPLLATGVALFSPAMMSLTFMHGTFFGSDAAFFASDAPLSGMRGAFFVIDGTLSGMHAAFFAIEGTLSGMHGASFAIDAAFFATRLS